MAWGCSAGGIQDQGMEHGLGLTVTTKHYDWYIKQGKMSQAGARMAVLTGAFWPGDRLGD
eukprot:135682-Karenia_brevis.AAC.1